MDVDSATWQNWHDENSGLADNDVWQMAFDENGHLWALNGGGVVIFSGTSGDPTTVDVDVIPTELSLEQNYPNPFNPSTTIEFSLPASSQVSLMVYDLLGREVATLVNGRLDAGLHSMQFDGSQLTSGIYMYRLQAGDQVQTRKLMLIK